MGKIGDNFVWVGLIEGKNEVKGVLKIKLKQLDGDSYDWSTFDKSSLNGYDVGTYVKVECCYKENPNGKWPFKNIEKVLGAGEATELTNPPKVTPDGLEGTVGNVPVGALSLDTASRNGKPPGERASIERQSSVNAAGRLVEIIASHYDEDNEISLTEVLSVAEDNLPKFLGLADSIFHYYQDRAATDTAQRQSAATNGDTPTQANKPASPAPSEPAESKTPDGPYEPPQMDNIGHLLTAALRRWNKKADAVIKFFSVDSPPEILNSYTLSEAWEALKANWDGPDAAE